MHIKDCKKGMVVTDRWWPDYSGVITKVLKTRIHVRFPNVSDFQLAGHRVYDKEHLQFLERRI